MYALAQWFNYKDRDRSMKQAIHAQHTRVEIFNNKLKDSRYERVPHNQTTNQPIHIKCDGNI